MKPGEARQALAVMHDAARAAGEIILRVYGEAFAVEYKNPGDPVTRADREANALICDALARHFPGVPLVAEESEPATYAGFRDAGAAFFVDPLDGTRDFVAKNGEFCVMIGLAEAGRASLGVIHCPALGRTFAGGMGVPAYELEGGLERSIRVRPTELAEAELLVSRSRSPHPLEHFATLLGMRKVTGSGSSGVKAVRVAAGEAQIYAQAAPAGMLWDVCAPEAIVVAAGGVAGDRSGAPFDYLASPMRCETGVIMAASAALRDAFIAAAAAVKGEG